MNPFTVPDKIIIYRYPQDMRAGIQRLSEIVAGELELDPMDGGLYVFVSRDTKKLKMLRFETSAWCCYYVRMVDSCFKWKHATSGELILQVERRQLLWLLEGLQIEQPKAPKPVTVRGIL